GQMALRFALARWSDVRADGWVPGDTRVHFLPPHAALLEAAAEDVAVVNLLARETEVPSQDGHQYATASHLTAFSGQRPAVESDAALVAVNTLNVHEVLGTVGLLHSHRIVFPLAFGPPHFPDDWSVSDWCDQCHRKKGLTVWAEPFDPDSKIPGGEALVALILGKIDALECDGRPRKQPLLPWVYRLWNAGFPVPLVGGSGKDSNRVVLGGMRTYARLADGEPLTYTNWIEAVRAGRTVATNGPLLRFAVDGHGPGETFSPTAANVMITASARCLTAFDHLEIVADGRVIASVKPTADDAGIYTATVELDHSPTESGWLAARCVGGGAADSLVFAHTSPVVVRVGGKPVPRRAAAIPSLKRAVEQTRDWVETVGHFTDDKWKRHLLELCDAALARLVPDDGAGP
ncbi:MAG: CehA/McbA family metallohydrolase, partial [Fimbriiglobus sp.]